MSSLQDEFKKTVWFLLKQQYNMYDKDPHTLTARNILQGNQIDKFADDLFLIVGELISAAVAKSIQDAKLIDNVYGSLQDEYETLYDYTDWDKD